jgi:hypothetical protein
MNLIEKDKKYLHSRLMVLPEPLISSIDQDGKIHHTNLEGFQERYVEYFTLDELVDYYYSKFPRVTQFRNRDKGALRYLLAKYDLDLLLFMIDVASLDYIAEDSMPPLDPFVIRNYEQEAIRAYQRKSEFVC